eukprot:234221_1
MSITTERSLRSSAPKRRKNNNNTPLNIRQKKTNNTNTSTNNNKKRHNPPSAPPPSVPVSSSDPITHPPSSFTPNNTQPSNQNNPLAAARPDHPPSSTHPVPRSRDNVHHTDQKQFEIDTNNPHLPNADTNNPQLQSGAEAYKIYKEQLAYLEDFTKHKRDMTSQILNSGLETAFVSFPMNYQHVHDFPEWLKPYIFIDRKGYFLKLILFDFDINYDIITSIKRSKIQLIDDSDSEANDDDDAKHSAEPSMNKRSPHHREQHSMNPNCVLQYAQILLGSYSQYIHDDILHFANFTRGNYNLSGPIDKRIISFMVYVSPDTIGKALSDILPALVRFNAHIKYVFDYQHKTDADQQADPFLVNYQNPFTGDTLEAIAPLDEEYHDIIRGFGASFACKLAWYPYSTVYVNGIQPTLYNDESTTQELGDLLTIVTQKRIHCKYIDVGISRVYSRRNVNFTPNTSCFFVYRSKNPITDEMLNNWNDRAQEQMETYHFRFSMATKRKIFISGAIRSYIPKRANMIGDTMGLFEESDLIYCPNNRYIPTSTAAKENVISDQHTLNTLNVQHKEIYNNITSRINHHRRFGIVSYVENSFAILHDKKIGAKYRLNKSSMSNDTNWLDDVHVGTELSFVIGRSTSVRGFVLAYDAVVVRENFPANMNRVREIRQNDARWISKWSNKRHLHYERQIAERALRTRQIEEQALRMSTNKNNNHNTNTQTPHEPTHNPTVQNRCGILDRTLVGIPHRSCDSQHDNAPHIHPAPHRHPTARARSLSPNYANIIRPSGRQNTIDKASQFERRR